MINYADYDFYENTYKGTLSSDLFNSIIPKASREIDKAINRETLKEEDLTDDIVSYKVKFVACEMVDYLNASSSVGNSNGEKLNSISIDGVSKSFANKTQDELNNEKISILSGLPLEFTRFI